MPTFGSLFAGIGGIDLGLERAGWTGRWQVEYEPFCQRVLARHWPDVHRVGDVHDAHGVGHCPVGNADLAPPDAHTPAGPSRSATGEPSCGGCLPYVDLIAGGFPCQPVSTAGRRRIQDDDRWLWPEFARCIREIRPRYVLVENVPGLLVGGGMDDVLGDLAQLGYDAEWESIPASAVGAPHLRYRVWIVGTRVAYPHGERQGRSAALRPPGVTGLRPDEAGAEPDGAGAGTLAYPQLAGLEGHERPVMEGPRDWRPDADAARSGWWESEPDVGRVAHGVPARVDRLRSLGNAVVPQVVEWIGRRILEEAGA